MSNISYENSSISFLKFEGFEQSNSSKSFEANQIKIMNNRFEKKESLVKVDKYYSTDLNVSIVFDQMTIFNNSGFSSFYLLEISNQNHNPLVFQNLTIQNNENGYIFTIPSNSEDKEII